MKVELPTLWDHQTDLLNRTRQSLIKNRSAIMCILMGGGKTRVSKHILGSAMMKPKKPNASGRVLFTVNRRSLVDNGSSSFWEEPQLPHGLIMAGKDTAWGYPVQVASIDSLNSWFLDGDTYKPDLTFDLCILDECHAHLSKFRTFLNAHSIKREELGLHEPYVLGLTATPQARGLSDVFNDIVMGPDAEWLMAQGFIKQFSYLAGKSGNLSKLVRTSDGSDFTEDSVSDAMSGLAGSLVRDWFKHAKDRATVGFFPRRSHAKEALELLEAAGVSVAYVDGETPDDERQSIFRRLNEGSLQYICNCSVIERGTDIPRIGCVQVCTAIGSLPRWLQVIGRGTRKHPDVPDCIVLDHGANVRRHGYLTDKIAWSLDWSSRPSKTHKTRPTVECPECDRIYRGGKCACGYEPKKKELAAQGLLFDGSELIELKPKDSGKKAKSPEDYLVSALYQAGRTGKTFGSAIFMARKAATADGVAFSVPKKFKVAGSEYQSIPFGDPDSSRKIRDVYGFTVRDYSEATNPYRVVQEVEHNTELF